MHRSARLASSILFAAALAAAADNDYKSVKVTRNISFTSLEYLTYDDLVRPLRKKVEKGKMDETDFQVETLMFPKGGVFAAEIRTDADDPIVKAVLRKGATEFKTCDSESSQPGLTAEVSSGGKSRWKRDESKPIMIFECGLRQPLPDSVTVAFVTLEGKTAEEHLLFRAKR